MNELKKEIYKIKIELAEKNIIHCIKMIGLFILLISAVITIAVINPITVWICNCVLYFIVFGFFGAMQSFEINGLKKDIKTYKKELEDIDNG